MIANFTKDKQAIVTQLTDLRDSLLKIDADFSLDTSEMVIKLDHGLNNIGDEKFRIVFFGAFTDGKSTVLSALTRRLDIDIAPQPTTDQVNTYQFGEYFIVDTPGLFSNELMHDEITKNYISEANVIIYVVDAVNPLRESHQDTVRWLLSDLNKIDATIFVINKMDAVTDLDDEKVFAASANIKREALQGTLERFLPGKRVPEVVPISADPFGQGLVHWMENIDDYKRLSRVETLEFSISTFVEQAKEALVLNSGLSVVKDIVQKATLQLTQAATESEVAANKLKKEIQTHEKNLQNVNKDCAGKQNLIKEDVINFREDILLSLQGASEISNLRDTIVNKIGTDGLILNERINIIISKHTHDLVEQQIEFAHKIDETLSTLSDTQKSLMQSMSDTGIKAGTKLLEQDTQKIKNAVIKFRDAVTKITGKKFKFKPYGAGKWAGRLKNFGKVLKALPFIVEVLDTTFQIYGEKRFNKEKQKISTEVQELFKDFLNDFTFENYCRAYFPLKFEIEQILSILEDERNNYLEVSQKIKHSTEEMDKLIDSIP